MALRPSKTRRRLQTAATVLCGLLVGLFGLALIAVSFFEFAAGHSRPWGYLVLGVMVLLTAPSFILNTGKADPGGIRFTRTPEARIDIWKLRCAATGWFVCMLGFFYGLAFIIAALLQLLAGQRSAPLVSTGRPWLDVPIGLAVMAFFIWIGRPIRRWEIEVNRRIPREYDGLTEFLEEAREERENRPPGERE